MSSDYEVGYGKPPKKNQFKPGHSGNKKGRPKGHKNLMSIIRECSSEKIIVNKNGKTIKMEKREALLHFHLNEAIKGNVKSARIILPLIIESEKQELSRQQQMTLLNRDDEQILNDTLAQIKLGKIENDTK